MENSRLLGRQTIAHVKEYLALLDGGKQLSLQLIDFDGEHVVKVLLIDEKSPADRNNGTNERNWADDVSLTYAILVVMPEMNWWCVHPSDISSYVSLVATY